MEANENSGERKIKRFKVREQERGGSGSTSFFPRSSAARRTDPLTEGLEQANFSPLGNQAQKRTQLLKVYSL